MSPRFGRIALAVPALLGAVSLAGCPDPLKASGTALAVHVDFAAGVAVDQLRFSGTTGDTKLFDPATRPEIAGGRLSSGQSLRILLPDSLDGQTVSIQVAGLLSGQWVAIGSGDGRIRKGYEVSVSVTLALPPLPDAGAPDAGPEADAGTPCNATTCPDGCCLGIRCLTASLQSCGRAGADCQPCDPTLADSCSILGACECGGRAQCSAGQRCTSLGCVCDATSCSGGCCSSGVCHEASLATCGSSGELCLPCDAAKADLCVGGACLCGSAPSCGPGQRCLSGACVCDGTSCPSGCCDTTGLCQPRAFATCGSEGASCVPCDGIRADNCSALGVCRCGTGAVCELGQHCAGGVCTCDPTSCSGCCSGTRCVDGNTPQACGRAGQRCDDCGVYACASGICGSCNVTTCAGGCCSGSTCNLPKAETCAPPGKACRACDATRSDSCSSTGTCACGNGPECATGQRCLVGACVCDATSCPVGCCKDSTCRPPAMTTCGTRGASCDPCDATRSDSCNQGTCRCGAGPRCSAGQRCEGGTCICDATSCPTGCCSGSSCLTIGLNACAKAGGKCGECDAVKADSCGPNGCACGFGPPCGAGQRCSGGGCICDSSSCSGCCSGTACLPGTDNALCGTGGTPCEPCAPETCQGGVCTGCDATSCADGCCSGATCTSPMTAGSCASPGQGCHSCDLAKADTCLGAGGCGCGNNPACGTGQVCLSGSCQCDPTSCSAGCCSGGECKTRSREFCGAGGQACHPCDAALADGCSDEGVCQCGGLAACVSGQECSTGLCTCNAASCPSGCCSGSVCKPPSVAACGTGGASCNPCDPAKADTCTGGVCHCGKGAQCGSGQRCLSGACVCDPSSCTGCCSGTSCLPGTANDACGTGGAHCQPCAPGTCNAGACTGCGSFNCATGCCSGVTCTTPSVSACATGGAPCAPCDTVRANGCLASGQCGCGTKAQCGAGQHCVGGACTCDATSCPSGCCSSGTCQARSLSSCGAPGTTCQACDSVRASSCSSSGVCQCGTGALCTAGQHCVSGSCVCDATSCPTGCCEGTTCMDQSMTTCGTTGGACSSCTQVTADRCTAGACACGSAPKCSGTTPLCQGSTCVASPPSCSGVAATCGAAGNVHCCASSAIPGGTFYRSYDAVTFTDKTHPATLSAFRLDLYEVTVGRFREFVNGGYGTQAKPPGVGTGANPNQAGTGWQSAWSSSLPTTTDALKAQLKCAASVQTWTDTAGTNEYKPINCVSWYEAQAFCIWDGGRLPSEAELSYAAAGGSEQRVYPWSSPATSTTISSSYAVYNGASIATVGSKSPTGDGKWGQADLAGNLREWTFDWYWATLQTPCTNCENTNVPDAGTSDGGAHRTMRGGAYIDTDTTYLMAADRDQLPPEYIGRARGFRCARPMP